MRRNAHVQRPQWLRRCRETWQRPGEQSERSTLESADSGKTGANSTAVAVEGAVEEATGYKHHYNNEGAAEEATGFLMITMKEQLHA